VLGEEGGQRGAADAVRQWLVDPLCGTLNYAVGTMLAAVNVALRHGAAAVADPFSDEVFFTDGHTAWVRHGGVDAKPTPSPDTRLIDLNLDPPFPSAPDFQAVSLLANPGFVERFRPRVVSMKHAPPQFGSANEPPDGSNGAGRATRRQQHRVGAVHRHVEPVDEAVADRPSPRTVAIYVAAFLLYAVVLRNLPWAPFGWFYVADPTLGR
jgi:hypothetical protein